MSKLIYIFIFCLVATSCSRETSEPLPTLMQLPTSHPTKGIEEKQQPTITPAALFQTTTAVQVGQRVTLPPTWTPTDHPTAIPTAVRNLIDEWDTLYQSTYTSNWTSINCSGFQSWFDDIHTSMDNINVNTQIIEQMIFSTEELYKSVNSMIVPDCAKQAHNYLLFSLYELTEALRALGQNDNLTVDQHWSNAQIALSNFSGEIQTILSTTTLPTPSLIQSGGNTSNPAQGVSSSLERIYGRPTDLVLYAWYSEALWSEPSVTEGNIIQLDVPSDIPLQVIDFAAENYGIGEGYSYLWIKVSFSENTGWMSRDSLRLLNTEQSITYDLTVCNDKTWLLETGYLTNYERTDFCSIHGGTMSFPDSVGTSCNDGSYSSSSGRGSCSHHGGVAD